MAEDVLASFRKTRDEDLWPQSADVVACLLFTLRTHPEGRAHSLDAARARVNVERKVLSPVCPFAEEATSQTCAIRARFWGGSPTLFRNRSSHHLKLIISGILLKSNTKLVVTLFFQMS